jgi:hypothetical protein
MEELDKNIKDKVQGSSKFNDAANNEEGTTWKLKKPSHKRKYGGWHSWST